MMNERIRELLEQAGFDVKRLLEPYPGGFPREDMLALESFAELIVRECAYVSEGYFGFKDHTPGTAIANEIKEHFGVGK